MNRRFLLLFSTFLSVATTVGCSGGKNPSLKPLRASSAVKKTVPDSAVTEKAVPLAVDSIGKSINSKKGSLDFSYDFPTSGPRQLVDSLRAYLSSEMAGVMVTGNGEDGHVKPYGNHADGKGMITYYAGATFKNLMRLYGDEGDTDIVRIPALSLSVMKSEESSRFVTYVSTFYLYSGGAHGMSAVYGVTFDKKTGAKLTDILNPKDVNALQPIIREGIEDYFRSLEITDNKEKVDEIVKDQMDGLFLDKGIVPLPASGVYLSPEGVVFVYGQYEIGAYAIGMPTFTVPYEKIKKFISPAARQLAGIK